MTGRIPSLDEHRKHLESIVRLSGRASTRRARRRATDAEGGE